MRRLIAPTAERHQAVNLAQPGTYALVLACGAPGRVKIGRLGWLRLQRGFYIYVGSALGPGGLAGRLRHHLARTARPHWHIDYLRAICALREIWVAPDPCTLEHVWASIVAGLPGANVPMAGFGASDCHCAAHLFFFRGRPAFSSFQNAASHPRLRRLRGRSSDWIPGPLASGLGQPSSALRR